MSVDDSFSVDVAADGTVLGNSDNGLVTAAPGRPRTRVPGGRDLFAAVFAGSRIAAVETTPDSLLRPVVLDPGAAAPRPINTVTLDLPVLEADANGVAWIANGCVLSAQIGAVAPAEPPAGPCPRVEVMFEEHDQTLRGRRLRM